MSSKNQFRASSRGYNLQSKLLRFYQMVSLIVILIKTIGYIVKDNGFVIYQVSENLN